MGTIGSSGILAQEKKAEESSAKGADKQLAPTADTAHKETNRSGGDYGSIESRAKNFMAMPDEEKAATISKKVEEVKGVTKSVNDQMKDKDNVVNSGAKTGG